jgi:hypothetical protein
MSQAGESLKTLWNHPIPVDTEVVRALANNPGCLDLYYMANVALFSGEARTTGSPVRVEWSGMPTRRTGLCA